MKVPTACAAGDDACDLIKAFKSQLPTLGWMGFSCDRLQQSNRCERLLGAGHRYPPHPVGGEQR